MSTERKKKLRKDIIEKFETIKYFCKKAEYSYSNFKAYLASRTPNEELYQDAVFKCESIEVDHIDGNIREEDREAIRVCILINFGSYTKFHDKHEDFNMNYLSNVINGKLKYETAKYNRLVKILKRDYNLKLETDEQTTEAVSDS